MPTVTVMKETVATRVGALLAAEGFTSLHPQPLDPFVEIVAKRNHDTKQKAGWFDFRSKRSSPLQQFGSIWFGVQYGATEQRWVLNVYGRENLPAMEQLAQKLSSSFGTDIVVQVTREQPSFLADPNVTDM